LSGSPVVVVIGSVLTADDLVRLVGDAVRREMQVAAPLVARPSEAPLAAPSAAEALPDLMRTAEVCGFVRLVPRTLRRLVLARRFPEPLKINRSNRWRKADVLAWAEQEGAK